MNTEENEVFLQKLDKHPRLKKRFNEILGIAENSSGELVTANEKAKLKGGNAKQLIAEMDGSMVPIVETAIPTERNELHQ